MNRFSIKLLLTLVALACLPLPIRADESSADVRPSPRKRQKNQKIVLASEQTPAPVTESEPVANSPVPVVSPDQESRTGRSWSLAELESVANTIHPILRRDLARIEAAQGGALQAGLYPNPQFENNPQVFTGQNTLLNAGITQEIVVKGKKRLDKAAAIKVVEQNEFAYVQDRFALLTAIRQQFYIVLAAERRVAWLKMLQKITSSSLETGRELERRAGEIPKIDVLVLEIDSQRVEADLENSVRIMRGVRNQLAVLVGDPSISEDGFQGSIYVPPPQYDEKILNEFVSSDSAHVQIQRIEIERNEVLVKRAIAEPYPNITLGPAYQWGLVSGNEQLWMTVAFPIPTWDRNQGNIQASRADLAASRMNLHAVQLEQLRRVADAFSRHRAFRMQATKYEKEIIPNTKHTLKLAQIGYHQGEYDFPRFLQVQRTFVQVSMAYIDLLENVWTTAAELSGLLQLENFQ